MHLQDECGEDIKVRAAGDVMNDIKVEYKRRRKNYHTYIKSSPYKKRANIVYIRR